ncbi:MAG: response regulator, partial [bacterium]|nr:response regulator [bacterium]
TRHLEKLKVILEEKVEQGTLELKREKEKIEEINLGLEHRVQERTVELVMANEALQEEITQKRKLQAQLLQAQKMEAVGTMAGGIAHDFNNLLMGIQGNASLILSEQYSAQLHREELESIEKLVRSGANLTRQLLGFAGRGKYEVLPTDLNQVIKKSLAMFARTKKELIIHEKYQTGIWAVEVDRGQIEQVLLNLYLNAWQAMPHGGEISLHTENVSLQKNDVKPYDREPGNYVTFSITDTGIGMDEATRQRIFEPFFTTREMGRGTGLGLASVYGIISNHGGFIKVDSEEGCGTTFEIYLPASGKEIVPEKEFKLPGGYLGGTETVLLVDDEEMMVEVGGKLLEKLGYDTLIARCGPEALDIFQKRKGGIALVILDLVMPGMGGGETFEKLKKINPAIKILLSSGYSLDGEASVILERGCDGFIQKPFDLKEFSQKIRSILDSPPRRGEPIGTAPAPRD